MTVTSPARSLSKVRVLADAIRDDDVLFGSLIRNNPLAIAVLDAQRSIQLCNAAFETLFGYESREWTGAQLEALIGAPENSSEMEVFTRAAMAGQSAHAVTRRRRKDGSMVEVDVTVVPMTVNGTSLGAYAFYRDLTEERRVKDQLSRFFDLSIDLMCVAGFDGTFHRVNPSWSRLLGYSEGELLAQPYLELVHPEDRDATVTEFSRLAHGDAVVSFENRVRCRDGSFRWLQWSAMGSGDAFYAVVRDNTARHQAEEQLQAALRMKSDFVSFVTHQLRTPLSGIKWMLELAAEAAERDEVNSYVQDARDSADRLIALVNDLLDVSRLENGRLQLVLEPVDLRAVTDGVLGDVAGLVRERQHVLTIDAAPALPVITADAQLLRQVVMNLVSNAIKYTPAGGRVAIRAVAVADGIEWSITDSGIGIPEASRERLFQKFYRAENALTVDTEGTGLGLYLVRLIVERFGGTITCESVEGQGTTFRFWVRGVDAAVESV